MVDARWWRDLCLSFALQAVVRQAARVPGPSPALDRARRVLDQMADDPGVAAVVESLPRSLLHGDVHPGNVLVADGKGVLVDRGSARIGCPMVDLANVVGVDAPGFAAYSAMWRRCTGLLLDPTTGRSRIPVGGRPDPHPVPRLGRGASAASRSRCDARPGRARPGPTARRLAVALAAWRFWNDVDVRMAADVQRAVDSYTGAVDAALPGFVEGLYVTGSIPLGDYRSGTSDVDMVAVCAERPAGQQLEALSGLHRPSRPSVDLLYVTRQDLECDPSSLSLPNALEGVFKSDGGDVLHSVEALRRDAGELSRWPIDDAHRLVDG